MKKSLIKFGVIVIAVTLAFLAVFYFLKPRHPFFYREKEFTELTPHMIEQFENDRVFRFYFPESTEFIKGKFSPKKYHYSKGTELWFNVAEEDFESIFVEHFHGWHEDEYYMSNYDKRAGFQCVGRRLSSNADYNYAEIYYSYPENGTIKIYFISV